MMLSRASWPPIRTSTLLRECSVGRRRLGFGREERTTLRDGCMDARHQAPRSRCLLYCRLFFSSGQPLGLVVIGPFGLAMIEARAMACRSRHTCDCLQSRDRCPERLSENRRYNRIHREFSLGDETKGQGGREVGPQWSLGRTRKHLTSAVMAKKYLKIYRRLCSHGQEVSGDLLSSQ
jgi:hypothetical protein